MSETRLLEEQKQQSLKDKEEKKRLKKVMFENEEKARKELEAKGKLFLEKSTFTGLLYLILLKQIIKSLTINFVQYIF